MQSLILSKWNYKTILMDSMILAVIYFTPAFSHLLNMPLYIVEPMRLMLFVSLLYSNKTNSFIIAASLPLFSLLTSGHPPIFKALLISGELLLNAALYFYLSGKIKNYFVPILLSISLAKIFYYIFKFGFISTGLLAGSLVSISLLTQVIIIVCTSLLFGGLLLMETRKK